MVEFRCDRCGLCCQNLQMNEEYSDLDDGTGVCIYYDWKNHLCTIYDNRPEKCNVAKGYDLFAKEMLYEEYLDINYQVCKMLKEN